jgi:hypothetical protein
MHAWSKSMEYQSIEYIYINENDHKNIIYPWGCTPAPSCPPLPPWPPPDLFEYAWDPRDGSVEKRHGTRGCCEESRQLQAMGSTGWAEPRLCPLPPFWILTGGSCTMHKVAVHSPALLQDNYHCRLHPWFENATSCLKQDFYWKNSYDAVSNKKIEF